MRTLIVRSIVSALVGSATALPAAAQDAGFITLEAQAGYAGFVDDATIDHGYLGGAFKARLTPRLSIGPEIVWMRGPQHDRDLFLTGTLTWDLVSARQTGGGEPGRQATTRVVPFLMAGGGAMRHEDRFGVETFASWEGAVTGGGGVRIHVGRRWYIAPEFRIGWEPHYRVGVAVGVDLED